jgi:antitoxin component YwqK of YwqJK toxin-antitoxin module
MSIVFNIQNKLVKLPYDTAINSKYIQDMLRGFGNNMEIVIPTKYLNIVDNYVNFLYDNFAIIRDRQYLKTCFIMSTYFEDDNYFNYLLQQLFDSWSYLFTIVYSNITKELQWHILTHCPYDFLPSHFTKNARFIRQWEKINNNKVVTINGEDKYYINYQVNIFSNTSYVSTELENYHTIGGKTVGDHLVSDYYDNGQLNYRSHYVNGEKQGLSEHWHENGQLAYLNYWNDNLQHGSWRQWYQNGQAEFLHQYMDGKRQGLWEGWYNNSGQPYYHGHFVDGKKQGLWEEWYSTGQARYCGHWVNNNKQGLWQEWYENGQLRSHGHYVNDERQGLWDEGDELGNVSERYY